MSGAAEGPSTCGVLLAGGAGARFGPAGKQLALLDGRPLLQWSVDAACASALDAVVVVLGARADAIRAEVDFGRARVVEAGDWAEGMAASLRGGVRAAAEDRRCAWAVVLLGDAPRIAAAAIDAVIAAALAADPAVDAVRLCVGGRPAHPVALRRALFAAAQTLRGDVGARGVLAAANVVELDGTRFGDPGDIDTPAALRALGG